MATVCSKCGHDLKFTTAGAYCSNCDKQSFPVYKDMLEDIFERNKSFTDHAVANSPREGHWKSGLNMGFKTLWELIEPHIRCLPQGDPKDKIMHYMCVAKQSINEEGPWHKDEIFKLNIIAMYRELGEFVDQCDVKWWGRGVPEIQREEALEELIDLMHFIMIAFDLLDCKAEEIHKRYVEKNNKNWERFEKKIGWDQNNEESNVPLDEAPPDRHGLKTANAVLIDLNQQKHVAPVLLRDGVKWPDTITIEEDGRSFMLTGKHDEDGMMQYVEVKHTILSEKELVETRCSDGKTRLFRKEVIESIDPSRIGKDGTLLVVEGEDLPCEKVISDEDE